MLSTGQAGVHLRSFSRSMLTILIVDLLFILSDVHYLFELLVDEFALG